MEAKLENWRESIKYQIAMTVYTSNQKKGSSGLSEKVCKAHLVSVKDYILNCFCRSICYQQAGGYRLENLW